MCCEGTVACGEELCWNKEKACIGRSGRGAAMDWSQPPLPIPRAVLLEEMSRGAENENSSAWNKRPVMWKVFSVFIFVSQHFTLFLSGNKL